MKTEKLVELLYEKAYIIAEKLGKPTDVISASIQIEQACTNYGYGKSVDKTKLQAYLYTASAYSSTADEKKENKYHKGFTAFSIKELIEKIDKYIAKIDVARGEKIEIE